MAYDNNVATPEVCRTIAEVCDTLRNQPLKAGESLFLPDFPLNNVAALNACTMTFFVAPVYVQADEVFGGAGVRLYSVRDIHAAAKAVANNNEQPEPRVEGDWHAPRSNREKWDERIGNWFGNPLEETAFYWDGERKEVVVYHADEGEPPPSDDVSYLIAPHYAFAFMCDEGQPYRNGRDTPPKHLLENPSLNAWVGGKMVVWGYLPDKDEVVEYACSADRDYATSARGINLPVQEDAPLYAWLGFNAAKAYRNPPLPIEQPETEESMGLDDL